MVKNIDFSSKTLSSFSFFGESGNKGYNKALVTSVILGCFILLGLGIFEYNNYKNDEKGELELDNVGDPYSNEIVELKETEIISTETAISETNTIEEAEITTTTTKSIVEETKTKKKTDYDADVLPDDNEYIATMYVTTNITELRIRSGPGYDYKVTYNDGIPAGMPIDIQAEEYDSKSGETWGYVNYNGHEGWSTEKYLSYSPTVVEPDNYGYIKTMTVTTEVSDLRMRSGPSYDYDVISSIPKNTKIEIYDEKYDSKSGETWGYVYFNDRWAWCTEKYMT